MIVTLTGPTAGGKSTLERELQALGFGRAISHTTRAPRAGEVDGEHYHFVDDATYDDMKLRGYFIETIELGTRRYALSAKSLQVAAQQGNVVIVVEPHGAAQISKYCRQAELDMARFWVFCSPAEQARRWMNRVAGDLVVGYRDDVTKSAAERLSLMLTVEQEWITQSEQGGPVGCGPYRYWIDTERAPAADLAKEIKAVVDAEDLIRSSEKVLEKARMSRFLAA